MPIISEHRCRHLKYRVEVFFKEIIIDGPLGKVKYYEIRVEFQFRGSPYIQSILWVIDTAVLKKDKKMNICNTLVTL